MIAQLLDQVVDRLFDAWTRERGPREAMEHLQGFGVPAGMLAHPAHHMEDPQLEALGYCTPIEQPGIGPIVLEGTPFRGSDLPRPIATPAPKLGEHTREIARQDLGLSDAEVEELIEQGVLEDPPPEGATPIPAKG